MKINLTVAIALSIAALAGSPAAQSQTYPAKPVRIIVPFSPGGGTDIVARTVAPKLADRFGQQVVVDNRVGAAGAIGAEITVRSPPDGYTLMVGSTSEIGIGPSLYSKLPYDVLRDLVSVTPLAATPMVLVVHPSMPVRTAKDLVALARARPGQINYGSAGAGLARHRGYRGAGAGCGVEFRSTPIPHLSRWVGFAIILLPCVADFGGHELGLLGNRFCAGRGQQRLQADAEVRGKVFPLQRGLEAAVDPAAQVVVMPVGALQEVDAFQDDDIHVVESVGVPTKLEGRLFCEVHLDTH